MKLAVIGPTAAMSVIGLSHYHMALGQELVRDQGYLDMYKRFHENGDFIIVDNGAAEPIEERVDFEEILKVCIDWADEIIMPDELGNRKLTLTRLESYWSMVPHRQRMIVPQGENENDWFRCLEEMGEMLADDFCTIGIPKICEAWPGGRESILRRLDKACLSGDFWIHALGVYKDPIVECILLQKFPCVRGIDTGAPVAYAQRYTTFNHPEHVSLEWNKEFSHILAMHNARRLMEVCNAHDI